MKVIIDAQFYITAWIDLLGQSLTLGEARPQLDGESDQEYAKVFRAAFGPIIDFRKHISDVQNSLSKILPPAPPEISSDAKKSKLYEKFTQQNIELVFIADSAVLRIPLAGSDIKPPLMSVMSLLYQLSINMLVLLAARMPIRGGVAVGWCTKLEKGDVYGQADVRAHWVESKIAQYPRIVLHWTFLDLLKKWEEADGSEEEKNIYRSLVGLMKSFFEEDTYGGRTDTILSYLSPAFQGQDRDGSSFHKAVERASSFISDELRLFKGMQDKDLVQRYEALKMYFIRHGYKVKE